jgi:uncharacterized membrane protein YraQ (UPF0718 family)
MPGKKDPVCGMEGHIKAHGHYFCSQKCIKKYEKKTKKDMCLSCEIKGGHAPWYRERLFIVAFIAVIILAISYIVPLLNPFFDAFVEYFILIWWAILLGVVAGGFIDHFVPREYIIKLLSSKKKRSLLFAVVFGFLMSACSHGILAIAIELYKKGASTPSTIAFLLASPWANLPITILLFGFFGVKALLFVVFALVIAIVTGLVYMALDKRGMIENKNRGLKPRKGLSILSDARSRIKRHEFTPRDLTGVLRGSWALSKMVVWWILIGIIAASFMRAFIPAHIFQQFLGPTIAGLIITLIVATVIEVCSEGSAPIAFEIFRQTGAFGNSFVFLMAGVATDYTEMGLIASNIGKKAALWLPIITVPQILVLGYLFNLLL